MSGRRTTLRGWALDDADPPPPPPRFFFLLIPPERTEDRLEGAGAAAVVDGASLSRRTVDFLRRAARLVDAALVAAAGFGGAGGTGAAGDGAGAE
jgi:hypothetical protein